MLSLKAMNRMNLDAMDVCAGEDSYGADECGVRWDLVGRVRQALHDDTYEEDERIDALLDRLAADLDL